MGKRVAKVKVSWLSVLGELLITAGVVLLLYVGWQLYVNDPYVGSQQQVQAEHFRTNQPTIKPEFAKISNKLAQGKVFGKIYIPRFDKGYVRLIGQGTFQKITLNKIGPGHYLSSQWPGQVGNFAVAAHRTSHGAPFNKIDTLKQGDKVFVETNDGWFTYEYRQTKVVDPTDIGVISRVPAEMIGAHEGGKYMTMTSCHPKWSNKQRIIVWLELVDQQPHSSGMPLALSEAQAGE